MILNKTKAVFAVLIAGTALTGAAMLPLPAAAQPTPKLTVPETEAATA